MTQEQRDLTRNALRKYGERHWARAVAHAPGKLLLRKAQLLPAQTDTGR